MISAGNSGSSSEDSGVIGAADWAGPRAGGMPDSTAGEPAPRFAGRTGSSAGGAPPMGSGFPPAGVVEPSSGGLSPAPLAALSCAWPASPGKG